MFVETGRTSELFPLINASLNGLSFLFLVLGYFAVKNDRKKLHEKLMMAAFLTSTIFLSSYLYYHFNYDSHRFQGQGFQRVVYFFILISHVVLATVMVPFILWLLWAAFKKNWDLHKKIARWTWPTWVYVSATGVLVYFFLYQWSPRPSSDPLGIKLQSESTLKLDLQGETGHDQNFK